MANIYVRSTDGSDADNGTTWALAKATLSGAAAIDAAGDTIFLSQAHSESTANATIALAGTAANPTRVMCANDAAEPPTAQASSAVVATTTTTSLTFTGAAYVVDGVTFNIGTGGTGTVSLNGSGTTGANVWFRNCNIKIASTGASSRIDPVTGVGTMVNWDNVGVQFAAAGQGLRLNANFHWTWDGGSLLSGGTSPTTLLLPTTSASAAVARISALDLTNASAAINLVAAGGPCRTFWRNVKLPASWSGAFVTGTFANYIERHEFYNCDSGDTNYRIHVRDYAGTLDSETTLVMTGGATDGATPLSWKVATTANAKEQTVPFYTPEFGEWGDTTGTSKTVTVEILHDSATALTDAEVWLEVLYLGTAASTLGSIASDARANVLGSAVAQTTSSATWTTTGMTNPNKQKLEVTFTPQKKGQYIARVGVAKASYTLYINPDVTVT